MGKGGQHIQSDGLPKTVAVAFDDKDNLGGCSTSANGLLSPSGSMNERGHTIMHERALARKRRAVNSLVWLFNVTTSVIIIFITKLLMTTMRFNFATTVCGLHFLTSAAALHGAAKLGYMQHVPIPFEYTLLFSFVGSLSIASANFSLLLNSVGCYQISKLALAPFVCFVEMTWHRRRFSTPALLSIMLVLLGVGIVTVQDVRTNFMGLAMAILFVVTSGLQQTMCASYQKQLGVQPHQLLANTAPVQGMMLLLVGPFLDKMVTGGLWLHEWIRLESALHQLAAPMMVLAVSCLVAVAVNLSQFMCLGRFSATSFQVLGHAKTVLVLAGGFLLFNEAIHMKQLTGMLLAVGGMACYAHFTAIHVSNTSSNPAEAMCGSPRGPHPQLQQLQQLFAWLSQQLHRIQEAVGLRGRDGSCLPEVESSELEPLRADGASMGLGMDLDRALNQGDVAALAHMRTSLTGGLVHKHSL